MTFFDYPTDGEGVPETDARVLLPDAPEQDWAALLAMATMRRVAAGETLISPGSGDRGSPSGTCVVHAESPRAMVASRLADARPRLGETRVSGLGLLPHLALGDPR